jgi:hypothetical protein
MSVATCNGFGSPETPGGELKRAEPDTELHCSPVLRPYAVTTRLRQGYGGQAGELPDGGEFPNGEDDAADSLKCWVSRNWFGVEGSGDFAHYLAGTRVERLRTIKGAFAYAGKRHMAKKEEMPVMEEKPGRYWGAIGREHLPLGKREDREVSAGQAVRLRRLMRRYLLANTLPEKRKLLRKSQLWSEDFTAKLFCNVQFWLERLPKLIGLFEGASIAIRNSGLQEEYTISQP